jgi:hypothetical protein
MSCPQASELRFTGKFGLGGAREHMRQPDDQRESRGYRRDGEEKQFVVNDVKSEQVLP